MQLKFKNKIFFLIKEKKKRKQKAEAAQGAGVTQKAGSFLCTLLSGRSALWVPEEPQAGRGAGVWGATWPVPSAQDEETGFGFQVCHQVQCDLVERTMDLPSPSRVLPPLQNREEMPGSSHTLP